MSTAIVIPCRGEGDVLQLIASAGRFGDVFIVDDNAIDGHAMEPSAHAGAYRVEVPADRHGFSEAYRLGIIHAAELGYDYIVEMDAGGSHNPESIPKLLQALRHGADLACGDRFGGGYFVGHWKRRLLSRTGTALFNLRHGTRWHDATGGFIAYKRSTALVTHGRPFEAGMHWYQSEVRVRAMHDGFMAEEVPIVYRSSSSSLNWKGIAEAAWMLFR